jgi:hypothetical protein
MNGENIMRKRDRTGYDKARGSRMKLKLPLFASSILCLYLYSCHKISTGLPWHALHAYMPAVARASSSAMIPVAGKRYQGNGIIYYIEISGGRSRARTCDLLLVRQAL